MLPARGFGAVLKQVTYVQTLAQQRYTNGAVLEPHRVHRQQLLR